MPDEGQAAYLNMMNMAFHNGLVEAIIKQTEVSWFSTSPPKCVASRGFEFSFDICFGFLIWLCSGCLARSRRYL